MVCQQISPSTQFRETATVQERQVMSFEEAVAASMRKQASMISASQDRSSQVSNNGGCGATTSKRRMLFILVTTLQLICLHQANSVAGWQFNLANLPALVNSNQFLSPANGMSLPVNQPPVLVAPSVPSSLSAPVAPEPVQPATALVAQTPPVVEPPAKLVVELAKSAPTAPTAPANSTVEPVSLASKIAEVAVKALVEQVAPNASKPEQKPAISTPAPASLQLMKPRRQTATRLEEQIISQHASNGLSSHSRLVIPDKKRANPMIGTAQSGSSSPQVYSGPFSSGLGELVARLKSAGISSRSSIVKAISENPLARTFASVSKTISTNKLVGSAAAASAMAAFGLLVSTVIAPKLLAKTMSSVDPMLSSASGSSSSFVERNQQLLPIYDPTGAGYTLQPADLQHQPSMEASSQLIYADPFYYSSPTSAQVYLGQMQTGGRNGAGSPQPPTSSSASDMASTQPTGGHYAPFYNSPAATTNEQDTPVYTDHEQVSSHLVQPPSQVSGHSRPPPRRSGPVAMRMDEATRQRLMEQLKRQQEYRASSRPIQSVAESIHSVAFVPNNRFAERPLQLANANSGQQWQQQQHRWIPADGANEKLSPVSEKQHRFEQQTSQLHKQGQSTSSSPSSQTLRPNRQSAGEPLQSSSSGWRSVTVAESAGAIPQASGQERGGAGATGRVQVKSAPASSSGQQVQSADLRAQLSNGPRLSRTPNQSSVKSSPVRSRPAASNDGQASVAVAAATNDEVEDYGGQAATAAAESNEPAGSDTIKSPFQQQVAKVAPASSMLIEQMEQLAEQVKQSLSPSQLHLQQQQQQQRQQPKPQVSSRRTPILDTERPEHDDNGNKNNVLNGRGAAATSTKVGAPSPSPPSASNVKLLMVGGAANGHSFAIGSDQKLHADQSVPVSVALDPKIDLDRLAPEIVVLDGDAGRATGGRDQLSSAITVSSNLDETQQDATPEATSSSSPSSSSSSSSTPARRSQTNHHQDKEDLDCNSSPFQAACEE